MSDYLLTREVAELLRTPESTLRYWRHLRTGPPSIKVGRRVLYRRAALLAWVQEREAPAEDERIISTTAASSTTTAVPGLVLTRTASARSRRRWVS